MDTNYTNTEALERLAKCKHYLHVLKSSAPPVQKLLLKHADQDLVISICEICVNILNGNLQLNTQSREALRRYKTILRSVASTELTASRGQRGAGITRKCKPSDWKAKRRYLAQVGSGAFLTSLLTSALGAIVGRVVSQSLSTQK